ncbi:MAG TPA: hypothetical protein VN911_02955 [Candidatus Acidoferrum sp.]|nr:hypothetical protein [Candidatus Acidoferrum sp.]
MKRLIFPLFLTISFYSPSTLSGQTHRPPGLEQADQASAQTDKNVPPPNVQHSATDVAKIEHDAEELSQLAQSIPHDIETVEKGMFPKDMIQKLNRIEKLSKRLRGQLGR